MLPHRVELGVDGVELGLLGRVGEPLQRLIVEIVRQGVEDAVPGRVEPLVRRLKRGDPLLRPGGAGGEAGFVARLLARFLSGGGEEGADGLFGPSLDFARQRFTAARSVSRLRRHIFPASPVPPIRPRVIRIGVSLRPAGSRLGRSLLGALERPSTRLRRASAYPGRDGLLRISG